MRRTLVCGALATALALSASASPDAAGIATPGIDNFGVISPTYFRGAQPDGDDYAELAKFGIKLVVDLQADGEASEQQLVENAGMKFYRIPMTTRVAPTSEQIASFLKLVNDPANQPVYVHCAGGRHRTGVMTAIYRMTHDSWTSEKAFKEMKQYKFGADFLHPEFKKFVYAYRAEPADPASVPGLLATATAIH
jgi:tyrosine-protein phosphatase SIW14